MSTLLRIDASARYAASRSRHLNDAFVDAWREVEPGVRLLVRDLAAAPPPFVDEAWIAGCGGAAQREGERLIDEVLAADVVLFGAPMYNWGLPANLKAWFDLVVVEGRTFVHDLAARPPYLPALSGKRAVVVSTRASEGYGVGGALADMNHLDPHLGTLLRVMGIHLEAFLDVAAYDDAAMASAMAGARALARRLALAHRTEARELTP